MKTKSIYYFLFITLLMYSCRGDDGPPGPRGPQGPAGEGGTGAVTIQYEILTSDWGDFGTFGQVGYGYGVELDNNHITQSVYDYGAVIAFFSLGSNTVWESLPASYSQDGFDEFINVRHDVGKVYLEIFHNDFQTNAPNETMYVKVVVIDGEASSKYAKPPVDLTNYEAVKAYYHLKD